MAKKTCFRLIKKLCSTVTSLIFILFTNNTFAVFPNKLDSADEKKQVYATFAQATAKTIHQAKIIQNMAEHGSMDQLKQYIEKLNNDELSNVYHYIFTFNHQGSEKMETAKRLIAKAHKERSIADIMEKMQKHDKKIKKLKFSHPIVYFPQKFTEKPRRASNLKSKKEKRKAKQKFHPVQIKINICSSCKERVPVSKKSTLFECKSCGYEERGYICRKCLSDIHISDPQKCRICGH